MTEPAPNPNGDPTVRLDGKSWPVPDLVVRQFRKIRRDLIDLTEAINPQFEKDPATGEVKLIANVGDQMMRLTAAQYDRLLECVYVGLTRAHPTLTREEFENFLYTDLELFAAFIVVRNQSQIFATSSPPSSALQAGGEVSDSGEAVAVSPTGTLS